MSEITVVLKDQKRTYREKFEMWDTEFNAHDRDPIILDCIATAKKNFDGEPDKIKITINFEF